MEADLQQFYGIALSDLGGSLSWRRLGVLIRQLPDESRLTRMLYPSFEWSTEAHLLALAIDHLAAANWQRGHAKGTPRPKPIQRPGMEDPETDDKRWGQPVPVDEARRILDEWNGTDH